MAGLALTARSVAARALDRGLSTRFTWTDEQLAAYEERALRRVVRAASVTEAQRSFARSLLQAPTLAGALAGGRSLSNNDLRGREHAFRRGRLALKAHTSGTTGTPLKLWRSPSSVLVEQQWVSEVRAWAGYEPGMPLGVMRGDLTLADPSPVRWLDSASHLLMSSYALTPQNVRRYRDSLLSHGVRYLACYPSSVLEFALSIEREGLAAPPVEAVFTSSETLTAETREVVRRVLGAECWDYYGLAERTMAAATCDLGRYHALPGYAFLHTEGGFVRGTSLSNLTMPLLNYRTDDSFEDWSTADCGCGRRGSTFARVIGRVEDFLLGSEGQRVGRLDTAFKGVNGLAASQLVQQRDGSVVVLVVPATGTWDPRQSELLLANLAYRLGPLPMTLEQVTQLRRAANGKVPFVIREV